MTITLTPKQSDVLVKALDCYLRLGLGQIWTVGEALEFLHPVKHLNHWDIREQFTNAMQKQLLGFESNSSYGISNGNVHDYAKIAFDMEQVLRGTQSLHMGSEPLIELTKTTP